MSLRGQRSLPDGLPRQLVEDHAVEPFQLGVHLGPQLGDPVQLDPGLLPGPTGLGPGPGLDQLGLGLGLLAQRGRRLVRRGAQPLRLVPPGGDLLGRLRSRSTSSAVRRRISCSSSRERAMAACSASCRCCSAATRACSTSATDSREALARISAASDSAIRSSFSARVPKPSGAAAFRAASSARSRSPLRGVGSRLLGDLAEPVLGLRPAPCAARAPGAAGGRRTGRPDGARSRGRRSGRSPRRRPAGVRAIVFSRCAHRLPRPLDARDQRSPLPQTRARPARRPPAAGSAR